MAALLLVASMALLVYVDFCMHPQYIFEVDCGRYDWQLTFGDEVSDDTLFSTAYSEPYSSGKHDLDVECEG